MPYLCRLFFAKSTAICYFLDVYTYSFPLFPSTETRTFDIKEITDELFVPKLNKQKEIYGKNTDKKVFFIVLSFVQLFLIGQLFHPIKVFFFSNLFKKIPGNLSIFELKIKKLDTSKTISDFIDLLIFCHLQKCFFKD